MNIKLALTALICSVAMSCSVSEGQLLDRMLSKVGCSVCESASPCDTGCDTGCGGEMISECGAVESCGGGLGILDKIKERLSQVGCGGGCGAAAEPCGCAAPVVESCGCDAAPACGGGGLGLLDRMKGRLSSMGSGCGCAAPAPVMMAAPSCGCDGGMGLMDKIQGRVSSLGSRVSSIGGGCSAPAGDCGCSVAPVVMAAPAPCASACDAAPSCGGGGSGLLDRLKGRLSSVGGGGGCGCAAAPVVADCGCSAPAPAPCMAPVVSPCGAADSCGMKAGGRVRGALSGITSRVGSIGSSSDCGCSAPAPVADCGCSSGGGRVRSALGGIKSRVGSIGSSSDCGCSAPAPVADCGCGSGAGSARARLSLLDRLRGNRIARDRSGRVIGGGCNDGCNSPCPQATSDCGCGAVAAPVSTGCSACGDSIMAAPAAAAGTVIYNDAPMSEGVMMESPSDIPMTTQEAVIEEAPVAPAVDEAPAVDPNAFIIRKGNIRS